MEMVMYNSEYARMLRSVRIQEVFVHPGEPKLTDAATHTRGHARTPRSPPPLVHRVTGRLCSIPLKVLWAVISKTIPWMAALIENNEGHIEHMVAVVSPFPPSSLSLLNSTPPDKRFSQTLPAPTKDLCGKLGGVGAKDIVKVVLSFF